MKLRSKLTLIFVLLTIVPIFIVSFLAYHSGRRNIEKEMKYHLVEINGIKSGEIKKWFIANTRSLELMALRPGVRQYNVALSKNNTSDAAFSMAKKNLIESHLKTSLPYTDFYELFVLCPIHGIIIASTNERQEGKYRGNEPYFLNGKVHSYIQNSYYSTSQEQAVITLATPIRDEQDNLIAVLAGHLDMDNISEIMKHDLEPHLSEESYLVNIFNFFVSEPRFGKEYALKKTVHTEATKACLSGKDGVGLYADYRGVAVIGAFKWLPKYQMGLITEIDQSEAYESIYHLSWLIAVATLVVIFLSVIISFLFARTITKPISQLVVGTEEIGRGNLNHLVGTSAKNEIGQLSRAFDKMTRNLKKVTASRDELNEEIAERKRIEQDLRQSEEKYRGIFDESIATVYLFDNKNKFLDSNQAGIGLLGYSREELLSMSIPDVDADTTVALPAHQQLLEGERIINYEHQLKRKDGKVITVLNNSKPITDADGNVTGMQSTLIDITERKQTEEALRERQRHRALETEVGLYLTRQVPLSEALQHCAEEIVKRLDAAFARVWVLNHEEQVLELQASGGLYTHLDGPHSRVPVGKSKIGLIASEKKPHLTNQVIGDPKVDDQEWAKREGMVAFAGYPLIMKVKSSFAHFMRRPTMP